MNVIVSFFPRVGTIIILVMKRFIATGKLTDNTDASFVVSKTPTGYTQRCNSIEGYNRDYISHESIKEIKSWLKIDFQEYKLVTVDY